MLAVAGWVAVDLGFRVPFAPDVSSLYAHDACVERGPMLGLLIPLTAIELLAGEQSQQKAAEPPKSRRAKPQNAADPSRKTPQTPQKHNAAARDDRRRSCFCCAWREDSSLVRLLSLRCFLASA